MKKLSYLLAAGAAVLGITSAFAPASSNSSAVLYDWHSVNSGDTVTSGRNRQSVIDAQECKDSGTNECIYATVANGDGVDGAIEPGQTIATTL